MNMLFRACVAASALAAVVAPVSATPKDYCLAYARDFADMGPKDEKTWTIRHDNALADCMFQYQASEDNPAKSAPEKSAPAKPVAKKVVKQAAKPAAKPKPVEVADPEPVIEEQLPEPAVIVAPDIEPPTKPAKRVAQPEEPKKKTLLAKFFKGKLPSLKTEQKTEQGKLKPGSAAWLDYCERKYASFNRETGTYQSYKGVERKCLVTD